MDFKKINYKCCSKLKELLNKSTLTLLMLLISIILTAQNGINYKAIIKDANGNVVANDLIAVQFTILQGVAQTNVYQETHTPTTDDNGIVTINIGEGTTSDVFTDINWSADDHFLNVQIDSGGGLVDLGTTQFMHVPYALQAEQATIAENVTGLERTGNGWRLIGMNPDYYGLTGIFAVDLSAYTFDSETHGATGNFSFASGFGSTASGEYSIAMGRNSSALGENSVSLGLSSNALGNYSIAIGRATIAQSAYETVVGRYNFASGNSTNWNDSDPLFTIGNGTSSTNRRNALTVRKDGHHIINSSYVGLSIYSESTGLFVSSSNNFGINVSSQTNFGAIINGVDAGVSSRSSIWENPDIILRGNSSTDNAADDGILSSDPNMSSSDLYLRSYDAVVVELDYNDNESGAFIVRNGDNDDVFSVNESGVIRQNGTTIHSSDRRLKKDIENLEYGLKEVLQLQPKQYFWKNRDNQKQKSLGLIAQEVQPIIQNVVLQGDDDLKTLGVSYTELIPVLINAIKELKQENNTLKINLEQKDTSINNLTERVKSIEQLLKSQSK